MALHPPSPSPRVASTRMFDLSYVIPYCSGWPQSFHQPWEIKGRARWCKKYRDSISQIIFVDDILNFERASISEAKCIDRVSNLFSLAMGMEVNNRKSSIFLFYVSISQRTPLLKLMPFTEEPADTCFKYLGFLLKENGYKIQDWACLTYKIKKKLGLWYHRWIFMAGRLAQIKSVIEAIPVYWMPLAYTPKIVLNQIKKMCSSYIWSQNKEDNKPPLCRWEILCKPKGMGGWGLKYIPLFSQPLATTSLWRLITLLDPSQECII